MGLGPAVATPLALKRAGLDLEGHRPRRDQRGVRGAGPGVRARLPVGGLAREVPHGRARSARSTGRRPTSTAAPSRSGIPVGSSANRLVTTLLKEMKRRGTQFGLATMCIGGGQGGAVVLELAWPLDCWSSRDARPRGAVSAFDLKVEDDGLATLTFDLPGEKVNKFSTAVLEELADVLVRLTREARIRGLLIRSGKPDIFIAGADVKEFTQVRARGRAPRASSACSRSSSSSPIFRIPTVAAINGACLGGGTELALACDYRLMSDSKKAQIGLPEVRLGIFPAWGGCTRLPQVVGLAAALDLILTGKTLDARRARKIGLADEAVPAAIFDDWARRFAREKLRTPQAADAARCEGSRRPSARGDAVRAPDDLRQGPGRRDEADRRPLPGAARSARGRGGGIGQAGPGRPRVRGPAHRARLRGRSPEEPVADLFPDGGGQEGNGRHGSLGPPARSRRAWACWAPASWAAESLSSARTRGCRRA